MKNIAIVFFLLVMYTANAFAQQPQFNVQVDEKIQHFGPAYGFTQDQQGYIWFSSFTKGLIRYDGKTFKTFRHDPEKPNSPASNMIISMTTDLPGNIWLAHFGEGLDKFDPVTNTFTHFKHHKTDANSLISDTTFSLMVDHTGKLWLGTSKGLQSFDSKTGKFTHFQKKINDKPVNTSTAVFTVYEDKQGIIWYSTGDFMANKAGELDGLFRLDPSTGKQTFYKADPLNTASLSDPFVTAVFEDTRGNFWVGTKGNVLHLLDRKTGRFTRHLYDPLQPGKLSGPPVSKSDSTDAISFIGEDHAGKLWIGSFENGINWYDPATKQLNHYGMVKDQKDNPAFAKDTLTGFKEAGGVRFMVAADSTGWITTLSGNIYKVAYGKKTIPYVPNKKYVNAFYLEPNGNILWFGTDSGLVRKDLANNSFKIFTHDPKKPGSLNNNAVVAITADENGKLYIGTHVGGLDLFDPVTEKFTLIKPLNPAPGSIMDSLHFVFIENDRNLWLAGESGLARVDRNTHQFTVYRATKENEKGIIGPTVYCIAKDKKNNLWFANLGGLDRFISDSNAFRHYLKGYSVRAVLVDTKGKIWAGTDIGLFQYDESKDQFIAFSSPVFSAGIETILNLLEDDLQNIWITTSNAILKMSPDRERIQMFNAGYGILSSNWNWLNNYKASDGRLFMGGSRGYYMFKPEELTVSTPPPLLHFSQLIIGSKDIFPGGEGILSAPIWKTEKIQLAHNQNTFSLDFIALNYNADDLIKYQYQLENFDPGWNNLGTDHKASFFNVPPGNYILRVRAINGEGTVTEKKLSITINPPWWKTWWAYCVYALLFGGSIWAYVQYRSKALRRENLVLEQKVEHRTQQLQQSIESLKAAQAQLVQSEKMASLGELTAGIAHEIQNPLNFVNNFSEINKELLLEMREEMEKGNLEDAKALANDVIDNEEKINHHGKRADGIVKGMLQHSRSTSGQKELTDINNLCDEYLRLSYHGLRAKDKSFNAKFETDFDKSIGKINVVPQDLGRVILNLINNAFYAAADRKKENEAGYEPTVTVITSKTDKGIEIKVKDNGKGIPKNIVDKIFQPFFTTKPTGEGTGLGLSLSYDIVKAHGGELMVETTPAPSEKAGTVFTISLPMA